MKQLRSLCSPLVLAILLIFPSPAAHAVAANLVLSKSTMNFGNVVTGSATQVIEIISNRGTTPISVASASVEGSDFQVYSPSFPLTVNPREQVPVVVVFSPLAAGNASGSLMISLDGSTPAFTVPLYGVGVISGQLSANPSNINLASGSSKVAETITNVGATIVMIQSSSTSGNGFTMSGPSLPLTLGPNQSAAFSVSMTSGAATASGSVTFSCLTRTWTAGERGRYEAFSARGSKTSLVVPISITASPVTGQLTPAPATLNFGTVQVGSTQSVSATLTNSGAGPVTITQASASGSGFSLNGFPLPMTLTPNESATFSASFSPQSAGSATGNISVVSNASNATVSFALSGSANAPGQLILSPASLNFGAVPVGKNQQLTATLTASGSSVTVSSASGSSSEFLLGGLSMPVTIPAGQSSSFTITFAPQASGTASASISFAGTASAVEAVNGSGSAPQHNVSLSWAADSGTVAGYNVYRGSQTGGPYAKLTSAPTAATAYGDASVSAGLTYFYVTTAVNSAGTESTFSNEVQAAVPSP